MSELHSLPLEAEVSASNRISVNDHAWIYREGGICTISYSAIPIFRFHEGDRMGTHLVMVHLIETGLAKASEVAKAFSVHRTPIGYFRYSQI
jgi:hypothetical protein